MVLQCAPQRCGGQYLVHHGIRYLSIQPSTKVFKAWHPEKGLLSSTFFESGQCCCPCLRATGLAGRIRNWSVFPARVPRIRGKQPGRLSLRAFRYSTSRCSSIRCCTCISHCGFPITATLYASNIRRCNFGRGRHYLLYRLSSVDPGWVAASEKGYANYTNLAPGQYRFEVRTGGSPAVASLDIIIMAPFWQTLWFKITGIVLLAGIIGMLVYVRFRRLRSEAALKERMANTEMMALRAQMNPAFYFQLPERDRCADPE